jgi:hypothetical protein
VLGFVGLGAREIYTSFYRFPFEYGRECFVNRPLGADKWSSGLYEISLPSGSHGAKLMIQVGRPNLENNPLSASFEILDSRNQVLSSQALVWERNGQYPLEISLPNGRTIKEDGVKAVLKLSSCYTPRNRGESVDSRRLGIIIDSSIIH